MPNEAIIHVIDDDEAARESLEARWSDPSQDAGVGRAQPRPAGSRIQIRRFDDLLCLHAGSGPGQRSHDGLLQVWRDTVNLVIWSSGYLVIDWMIGGLGDWGIA